MLPLGRFTVAAVLAIISAMGRAHAADSGTTPFAIGICEFGWNTIYMVRIPDSGYSVHGLRINLFLGNHRDLTGLDLGIGCNELEGSLRGVGVALLSNESEDVAGLQVGGIGNASGTVRGAQIGGFGNLAGAAYGLQAAGFLNSVWDGFQGLQVAGYGNVSGAFIGTNANARAAGAQFALFQNTAVGDLCGVQVSLANDAYRLRGVQAGLFNKCVEMRGLQVGAINWCRTLRGLQLGIINLQPDSELPLLPVFRWRF